MLIYMRGKISSDCDSDGCWVERGTRNIINPQPRETFFEMIEREKREKEFIQEGEMVI